MNGNIPTKEANTHSTIDELKAYFATPQDSGDEMARLKIVQALQVIGAAAWIDHNAAKRNYHEYRKATGFLWSVPKVRSANPGPGQDAGPPAASTTVVLPKPIEPSVLM